jgi:hypothetical protein
MSRTSCKWVDPNEVGLIGYISNSEYTGFARIYIANDSEGTDWILPDIGYIDVDKQHLRDKANDAYFSGNGTNALSDRIVGIVKGKDASYYLYSSGKVRRQARGAYWYNYWCYEELSDYDIDNL